MFLKRLLDTNKAFVDASLNLYKKGLILPDSYCIDVDMFLENAKNILNEAKKYNINLFYMLKQVGRNPYLAKKLSCRWPSPKAAAPDGSGTSPR